MNSNLNPTALQGRETSLSDTPTRSPHPSPTRSQLVKLIQEQRLTDLIELSGLTGQDALLAIQVAQCWLCSSTQSTIAPAIADNLLPSRRCADCDCFLEVVQ